MTKIYFFELFSNIGLPICEGTIKRLFFLTYGIIQSKTVNLSLINDEICLTESKCKNESSQYAYLLKIFQTGNYGQLIKTCFRFIVLHFYGGEKEAKILIDRTNWDLGTQRINILTLGLLTTEGTFIPLIWDDLGYKGNSDSETRIELSKQLVSWWKEMCIPLPIFEIIGDREFIGEQWLVALSNLGIKYVIRLRIDLTFETWLDGKYQADTRRSVPWIHQYTIEHNVPFVEVVLGSEAIANVFVVKNNATQTYKNTDKSPQDTHIYFISNIDDVDLAAKHYQERWKIEVCFKHLKSAGFNLEDFNLVGTHKTNIMMAILALVYAMTVKQEPEVVDLPDSDIHYKKGKAYPRKSVFRKGKARMTKIKSVELFLQYFITLIEKLIIKKLKLNQLYINNLYTQ